MEYERVISSWGKTLESVFCGPVDWIQQSVEHPELVMLGGSGETYGLLDMAVGRMIDVPAGCENLHWKPL